MTMDDIIQDLAFRIYEEPLVRIRGEADYPDLCNPLHVSVLVIDCDTEINMNGILGFLENSTGRHLQKTIEALRAIGARKCAEILDSVQKCMEKHHVTWNLLRGDFKNVAEFEITSFQKLHDDSLELFTDEVSNLADRFAIFNSHYSPEDAYTAFHLYLQSNADQLQSEIEKRNA